MIYDLQLIIFVFVDAKVVINCLSCKKNGLQKCAKRALQTFAKEKSLFSWFFTHNSVSLPRNNFKLK
jgi:hypothetical protein